MNVRVLSEPLTLKLVDNEADLRMGRRIGVVDWDQQVVTNYQEHYKWLDWAGDLEKEKRERESLGHSLRGAQRGDCNARRVKRYAENHHGKISGCLYQ